MRYREKDRIKIILGIDPGSIVCGYGAIKTVTPHHASPVTCNVDCSYITSGRIVLSSQHPLHTRLKEIYDTLTDIIKEYSPDEVVVEKVFFAKSVKSALTLGQARGAALLAASSGGLPVYEYSALEVKKAIVGYGRAEKLQVQRMISDMLNLKTKPSKDSADALALALCHANTMRVSK